MPNPMTDASSETARYRWRVEGAVSTWVTEVELRRAARSGDLPPNAEIQSAGKPTWVLARMVKGLVFGEEEPEENTIEPSIDAGERLARFGTMRELLGAFARSPLEINLEGADGYRQAQLVAVMTDHFEVLLDESHIRAFIPYNRVRAIASLERGSGATYRETHALRVQIDACAKLVE